MNCPKCKTGRICDRTEFYQTHSTTFGSDYEAAGCYLCGLMQWRISAEAMLLPLDTYWSSEEARQRCKQAGIQSGVAKRQRKLFREGDKP